MILSPSEINRLQGKVAENIEVGCTTFDYAKTIEFQVDEEVKRRFRNVAEAKKHAAAFQKLNPGSYVTVIELKKKVHEFNVKRKQNPATGGTEE